MRGFQDVTKGREKLPSYPENRANPNLQSQKFLDVFYQYTTLFPDRQHQSVEEDENFPFMFRCNSDHLKLEVNHEAEVTRG